MMLNIGILGAGGIARKMAETVARMPEARNYAVASRSADKAEAFAGAYGAEKAYGSYEEMLADPAVEMVYIALPHSHHCEWTVAALEAGKHVLCEKAFAANAEQARRMIDCAEGRGLLLTEAIWTRYMPSRALIDGVIASGRLGEIRTASANLGYDIDGHERIVRPELAGGALLDLTVYPLNFMSMTLGDDIRRMEASCILTETGVDGQDSVMLEYEDGRLASLFTTIYALTDRRGMLYGTEGFLEVENINNPRELRIWSPDRNAPELIETIHVPEQLTGYEYEVRACVKAIAEGRTECEEMPHRETLLMMERMDEIRTRFGIVYPFERE